MKRFSRWKELNALILTVVLFIAASLVARSYESELVSLLEGHGAEGIALYLVFILVTFVIAPIGGTLMTFPVVVVIWGPYVAALVTLVGWSLGTVLTYFLSRKYGRPLVERFVARASIERFGQALPKTTFTSLVIAHAVFPGDFLGYVLGLVIRTPYWKYGLAAILGNIPYLIVLTFAASLNLVWQVALAALSVIVILLVGRNVMAKLATQ